MELTVSLVVAALTFVLAELLKGFTIKPKYIPFINLVVGLVSAVIVIVFKIGEFAPIENIFFCILASMGAGGIYDITATIKKSKEE